mmetsp:Transcript_29895/g.69540  ORF Transcript_29895/g.69540 Transcript_29895/m.69540 type:complete len:284 (-) Transcript_29895:214-1065(-)
MSYVHWWVSLALCASVCWSEAPKELDIIETVLPPLMQHLNSWTSAEGVQAPEFGWEYEDDAKLQVDLGPLAEGSALLSRLHVSYPDAKKGLTLSGKSSIIEFWRGLEPHVLLKGIQAFKSESDNPLKAAWMVLDENHVMVRSYFSSEKFDGEFHSQYWVRSDIGMAWKLQAESISISKEVQPAQVSSASTASSSSSSSTVAAGTTAPVDAVVLPLPASTAPPAGGEKPTDEVSQDHPRGSRTFSMLILVCIGCILLGLIVKHYRERSVRSSYEKIKGFEAMLG